MSYYVNHSLMIVSGGTDSTLREFIEGSDNEEMKESLECDGSCYGSTQWRRCHEDMISRSKDFPDVVFRLDMSGQCHPDLSSVYYHDGRYQTAKISIVYGGADEDNWVYGNGG